MVFKTAFAFLGKIFGFKKGALALMSAATSTSIVYYLDTILQGTQYLVVTLEILGIKKHYQRFKNQINGKITQTKVVTITK